MKILGIETSCDETAASVVKDGTELLSNIISSQASIHAEFGGVVPEIAFRKHLENVIPVIDMALKASRLTLGDIDGVAVSSGPGLMGALLVGIQSAKGISLTRGIPLIPVNHIEGHIHAVFLENNLAKKPQFPFIALVVSGGHSHLYLVKGHGMYSCLGQTVDDAAGESFDKVAKMLALEYPGGPVIDRLSKEGDPKSIKFPIAMMKKDNLNFSFSGLKTAVRYHIEADEDLSLESDGNIKHTEKLNNIASSFQYAIVEALVRKTALACKKTGVFDVVITGGVACNSLLRSRMQQEISGDVFYPSPIMCTDNAAMIAACGFYRYELGECAGEELDARPRWPLSEMNTGHSP